MKKTNLQTGMRLFLAGLILAFSSLPPVLNFILAAMVMTFPTWNLIAGRLATGAGGEGDTKALLDQIKAQTEQMLTAKGFCTKAEIDAVIEERMKRIKDFNFDELNKLIDADKGVMAILKKQGESITALKESGKNGGDKDQFGLKNILKKFKDKAKEAFNSPDSNKGLTINVAKAAAVMTTANTVEGHDDLPTDLIESFSEAAFVPKRYAREYVYDLANVTRVAEVEKYKVWLEEGDTEGAFAIVAEGGLKPLVSGNLVRNFAEARKIAGKYVVTEEFEKFWNRIYQIIVRILQQKMLREKADILTVDLLADAAPYTASALDNQYANPNDFQAIGAVAAQIESLNFMPDMLIINPQDKWRIGMSTAEDGHFYMPNMPIVDPTGNLRLLGFIVRTSNKVPVGNFLLGESGLWEIEEEGIQIRMGYGITVTKNGSNVVTEVESDFDTNKFRVIVEQYFLNYLATNNEGSFVYANFNSVKAALEGDGNS